MESYKLSAELSPHHSSDVKCVLGISSDLVATASRDQTVGIWKRNGATAKFELEALLGGHDAYINALAYIPSDSSSKEDYIASSGNSSIILLHSLSTLCPQSSHALIGHSLNVCTLFYSAKLRRLISGSWDGTARIWSRTVLKNEEEGEWKCDLVLGESQAAVWGVGIVEEGEKEGWYLTGSADRMIYLFTPHGRLSLTIKGSPEPVRSISVLPGGENFASACNDGLIRIWDFAGNILQVLKGHEDYVYDVIAFKNELLENELLSCGEDHTARLWKDGVNIETILHPCQTVWSVHPLPNGDIMTGGSDGIARIFTTDDSRMMGREDRDAYYAKVTEAMRHRTTAVAEEIVIDIDIKDDEPPIPLKFTHGQDPRRVAEDFGREHSISDNYVNQIEEFIRLHIA